MKSGPRVPDLKWYGRSESECSRLRPHLKGRSYHRGFGRLRRHRQRSHLRSHSVSIAGPIDLDLGPPPLLNRPPDRPVLNIFVATIDAWQFYETITSVGACSGLSPCSPSPSRCSVATSIRRRTSSNPRRHRPPHLRPPASSSTLEPTPPRTLHLAPSPWPLAPASASSPDSPQPSAAFS